MPNQEQEQEQEQDLGAELRRDLRPPTPAREAEPLVAQSGLSAAGVQDLPEVRVETPELAIAAPEPLAKSGTTLLPAEAPSGPATPMASAAPSRAPESGTFQLAAPCPPPAAKAPPAAKVTKGDRHRAYAEAYARGMTAASGLPFAPRLTHNDQQAMIGVLQTFAREYLPDGPLLHGTELFEWIEESAATYRRLRPDARFEGGWSPTRWGAFLSEGATAAPPSRVDSFPIQRPWSDQKAWKIDVPPRATAEEEAAALEDLREYRRTGIMR